MPSEGDRGRERSLTVVNVDHYALQGAKAGRFLLYFALALAVVLLCYSFAIGEERGRVHGNQVARVTSMTPTKGVEGDRVSIVCSAVRSVKKIDFAGVEAAIVDSSLLANGELRLTTCVPPHARSGAVTVRTDKLALEAGTFVVLSVVSSSETYEEALLKGRSGSDLGGRGAPLPPPPPPGRYSDVEPTLDLPVEKPVKKKVPEPKAPPPAVAYPPVLDEPPPPTIYEKQIVSENATIVFVIDVSGSMTWDRGQYTNLEGKTVEGDRLDRAKVALSRSILSLPKNFRFTMLAFDCSVYEWRPSLVQADEVNKKWALTWIQMLRALGATGTGPAVSRALAVNGHDVKLVVLLTDGSPNCGAGTGLGDSFCLEEHRKMIRSNNTQGARIDVFAIVASGIFQKFCENVAGDSGGVCHPVN